MNSKIMRIKIILGSLAAMLAIGAGVSSADSDNRNLDKLDGQGGEFMDGDSGNSGAHNYASGSKKVKKKAKRKTKKKAKKKAKRKTKKKAKSN